MGERFNGKRVSKKVILRYPGVIPLDRYIDKMLTCTSYALMCYI